LKPCRKPGNPLAIQEFAAALHGAPLSRKLHKTTTYNLREQKGSEILSKQAREAPKQSSGRVTGKPEVTF
jgi:hypothetical protein